MASSPRLAPVALLLAASAAFGQPAAPAPGPLGPVDKRLSLRLADFDALSLSVKGDPALEARAARLARRERIGRPLLVVGAVGLGVGLPALLVQRVLFCQVPAGRPECAVGITGGALAAGVAFALAGLLVLPAFDAGDALVREWNAQHPERSLEWGGLGSARPRPGP